jgi:hypothetical protein
LHHGHVLNIRGESYRLREKKQAGLIAVVAALSSTTPPMTTRQGWVDSKPAKVGQRTPALTSNSASSQ